MDAPDGINEMPEEDRAFLRVTQRNSKITSNTTTTNDIIIKTNTETRKQRKHRVSVTFLPGWSVLGTLLRVDMV